MRAMQIIVTLRFHAIPVKMTKIKNDKRWHGCGKVNNYSVLV